MVTVIKFSTKHHDTNAILTVVFAVHVIIRSDLGMHACMLAIGFLAPYSK